MFPGGLAATPASARGRQSRCVTSLLISAWLASLVYVWYDMHEFLPFYLEDTAKKDFKMEKKKILADREG